MAKTASRIYAAMRSRRAWLSLAIIGILLFIALRHQDSIAIKDATIEAWDQLGPSRQALVALIATTIGVVAGYLQSRKHKDGAADGIATIHRPLTFPFDVYSTNKLDVLGNALGSRHFELPRSARLPQAQQIEFEAQLGDRLVLLTGRRGLGKTRECIELFRRLAEQKGEEITILHPRGEFDRPQNATVPADFAPRTLILFIDEIETRCSDDHGNAAYGQLVRTFHDRLAATIDWISDRQGSRDWKIVLTASDEAEDLGKIDLSAGIFRKFSQIQLPAIRSNLRKGFIASVARHFSISIDSDVTSYIAAVSDGTPRGIIIPFAKRHSELGEKRGAMTLAYAQQFRFSYPSDWESEVFEPLIHGHPERAAVFDAFAILRHYHVEYDKRLVIFLSARILQRYSLHYLDEKIVSKTIKRDLRAWIFDTPGANFLCPAAYIGHFVDLEKTLPAFLESLERAARSGTRFDMIRPALPGIERIAAKGGAAAHLVIGSFRRLSRQYPDVPQIWNALSKLCALDGMLDDAHLASTTAVAIGAGDVQSLVGLAYVEERRGHIQAAIDAARKATEVGGDNDFAWLNLGVLLGKRGRHREAITVLQRACELNPEGARSWFSLGIVYERAGLIDEAIDSCRRATELEPSNFVAWHTLGIAYDKTGKFPESIKALQAALKLKRSEPSLWLSLAWSLIRSGDNDTAIDVLENVQALHSNDADLLAKISVGFNKAGDLVRSDRAAEMALEIDRDNEVAKRCLAFNLLHSSATADRGLERLAELARSSRSPSDFCALSSAYRRAGRFDEAIDAARQALRIEPESDHAKRSLAINLGLQNAGTDENIKLREELARSSGAASDWVTLSVTYSKAGRPDDAVEAARQALAIEPENGNAKRSLAINLESQNRGSEENIKLREELARVSNTADDWVALSFAYSKANRRDDGIDAARQALLREPDNARAKRSLVINLELRRTGSDPNATIGSELRDLAGAAGRWSTEIQSLREIGSDELAREVGILDSGDREDRADEALRLREELAGSSGTVYDWTALSIAYNKAGRSHDAVRAARRAVEIDPENQRARSSLAINLALTEPGSEQTQSLLQEIDTAAATSEELVAVSIAYSKAGMSEPAVRTARRALALDASNYHAKRSIAINLTNLNPGSSEAIELRQQVADASNLPEDWYGLGCLLGSARRFEEAAVALERALAESPGYTEAESALAQNLANLPERVSEAIAFRERRCALHGTANDWTELSWAYGKAKRHDEAISAALRALTLDPRRADALKSLALNIPSGRELDENILGQIESCFATAGTADSWLQLARYYGLSHQSAKAVEASDRVIALDAKNVTAWRLKALNLDALNHTSKADEAWGMYARLSANAPSEPLSEILEKLEDNPYDKAIWKNYFSSSIDSNDIAGATAQIRKFGKDHEVIPSMAVALADVMSLNFSTAAALLMCVLTLQEDNAYVNHLVGTAKRKSGCPQDAIPFLKRSCELAPSRPNFFYTLGRAFQDLNDQDLAKQYFAQALAIDPLYHKASYALEELEKP